MRLRYSLRKLSTKPRKFTRQHEGHSSPLLHEKSAAIPRLAGRSSQRIKNIELETVIYTKSDTLGLASAVASRSDPRPSLYLFSVQRHSWNSSSRPSEIRIGFSSIDSRMVSDFKADPAVECFLLHARAHASGLNLGQCQPRVPLQPLLNTGPGAPSDVAWLTEGQQQRTNSGSTSSVTVEGRSTRSLCKRRRDAHWYGEWAMA